MDKLQIDIWTIDNRCDRITYICFVTVARLSWYFDWFITTDVMDGFPILSMADHQQWRQFVTMWLLNCSLVSFGSMLYVHSFYYHILNSLWSQLSILTLISYSNFKLWLCSCQLLCNIWCIGTEPYFTNETEEDQAFQTFEPTDELEWRAGDAFWSRLSRHKCECHLRNP